MGRTIAKIGGSKLNDIKCVNKYGYRNGAVSFQGYIPILQFSLFVPPAEPEHFPKIIKQVKQHCLWCFVNHTRFLCCLPLAWLTLMDYFLLSVVRHTFSSRHTFFFKFLFYDKVPTCDTHAPGSTPF